jgi:hypothetical protein
MFAFVGCNNKSNIEVDYDEQIAFPTNLEIDGTVLSWDEVPEASGYYVFIDGERVDSVRNNSFDFSKKVDERLVFNVQTKAPRGMQDSILSTSIAYIENKTLQIALMEEAVSESAMPFNEDFIEELVNKGMLASEFVAMSDAMEAASDDLYTAETIMDYYELIKDLMDNMENPEPMISALVKYSLVDQLEEQIEFLELRIEEYQYYIDNGMDYWGSYQDQIDELEIEMSGLYNMLDLINDSPDEIVKSVLFVFDYIRQIEEMVTDGLISDINNLMETDDLGSLNVAEIVLVKEEMVNILNETMPEHQDFILVISTLYTFSSAMAESEGIDVDGYIYPEKTAATALMSFEAFIRFLDGLDEAFFTELKAIGDEDNSDYMAEAKLSVLFIEYFDKFLDDNEDLLDQIDAIYTDEEKEQMFDQYMDSAEALMEENEVPSIVTFDLSFMSFERMMALRLVFEDAFNDLLDAMVKSEGQVILLIAEAQEYSETYWDLPYEQRDYNEYDYNNTVYQFEILDQIAYLMNSVVSEMTEDEFSELVDFLVDYLKVYLPMVFNFGYEYSSVQSPYDIEDMLEAVETFIADTLEDGYDLSQTLFAYLDEKDVFADYLELYQSAFEDNPDLLEENEDYFSLVFLLNFYDDFMSRSVKGNIDGIITELSALLANSAFDDTVVEFDTQTINDLLDYLDDVSDEANDFVYENMPRTQKDRLDEIFEEIQDIMVSTTN